MWQEPPHSIPAFPSTSDLKPETDFVKGKVTIMMKKRLLKMSALAMSLTMLFSVTAFATSTSWTQGSISCYGSCERASATTSASSPTYVEAIYSSTYQVPGGKLEKAWEQSDNSGTSITAYASIPSNASIYEKQGAHRVGSGTYHYTN